MSTEIPKMFNGDVESLPKMIEKSDIEALPIEIGGTEIVLQRHGKYERSIDSPNAGSLTPEGGEDIYKSSKDFFKILFTNIPEQERGDVDILVIASDTQYRKGGRRSMETADMVMRAIKEELTAFGLSENQLLNKSKKYAGEGKTRPAPKLREPQMFDDSPEFVQFLRDKYGDLGKDFWIAFEEDVEKETREAMKAEGPGEIANRLKFMVEVLDRYSRMYHKKHPEKRLIIWAATHYDTISPYVKQEILGVDKKVPLGVDYGAGIAIEIDPDGDLLTRINGKEYKIPS